MTTNLPYQLLPLKDAFADYSSGTKAFLEAHGDFVNQPKDCYVAIVIEDFTNHTNKTCDVTTIFGVEIALPNADANLSAIVFKKDLHLPNGGFCDYDSDYSPSLIIEGNLSARLMTLSGGNTLINGNCTISEVLYGFYNHGELIVNGFVDCPLIIANDYSMQLNGTVITNYIMGTAWKTLAPLAQKPFADAANKEIEKVPVWDVGDDAKKIKATIDPFFMDAYGFDDGLINIALVVGDCLLKDKPSNAKKRNKKNYYQLSDYVKAKLSDLESKKTVVTTLQLGGCHMGQLPDQFKSFTEATTIDLRNNSIKALPVWFVNYTNLQHLNISTNDIKKLILSPHQFANLQSLNITETLISKIGEAEPLPNLTELCFAKKDYLGNEKYALIAADFNYARTPNLQHLHINETGWYWDWHADVSFYQCTQLKYLHFGYLPRGAMGKQLTQLKQLEFYGFETPWQFDNDDNKASTIEIDIDIIASLPRLQMLYITKDTGGITKETITELRMRLPNLTICAPYAKFGFAMDDAFEKLNTQFEKTQNYQQYAPKNEATVQQMISMVQQHRLNISPKWFDKTWLHILMHLEGKARHCKDTAEKSQLIKDFFDATQWLKPHIAKTASWTHLITYGYDLWELVHSAEIWYALRRDDHNAEHLAWALEQLAIYLPIEQKQGHRKEFAGLFDLAQELARK